MSETENDEYVYPGDRYTKSGLKSGCGMGLTLRDWFAGQALAGYFANSHTPHQNAIDCAGYIYEMADAMLEARK